MGTRSFLSAKRKKNYYTDYFSFRHNNNHGSIKRKKKDTKTHEINESQVQIIQGTSKVIETHMRCGKCSCLKTIQLDGVSLPVSFEIHLKIKRKSNVHFILNCSILFAMKFYAQFSTNFRRSVCDPLILIRILGNRNLSFVVKSFIQNGT